jgi:endonuclease YncB( thermonuclease family)
VSRAVALCVVAALAVAVALARGAPAAPSAERVDRVIDGDTIELRRGTRVRLVQIDTPEVFEGECYGAEASRALERLLPDGTRIRLEIDPATDRVDRFGRLLRYVVRVGDGVNVNLRLVAIGAAAPYFYDRERGRYAARLESLARRAKARKLGLWGACPRTRYDPYRAVTTRR